MNYIEKHILSEYPNEACGIIVAGGEWLICKNIAQDKTKDFVISANEYGQFFIDGTIEGVWHSHCISPNARKGLADPRWMTKNDMFSWQRTNIPWHIFATEGENVSKPLVYDPKAPKAPLLGREYIWGTQDCFNLAIDYYEQKGIILPNPARDYGWWNSSANLFIDGLAQSDFKEVQLGEARDGDAVLIRLAGTGKVAHCGVIEGNQLIHHLAGALSVKQPLETWLHQIVKVVRYSP